MTRNGRGTRPAEDNRFGELLHHYLTTRHWSQTDFAKRAVCDHSYVSRAIAGTRAPSREMVLRWAKVLCLDAGQRDRMLVYAGYMPVDPVLLEIIDRWIASGEAA